MTDPLFDAELDAAALVRRAETAEELARDAIRERDAVRAALVASVDCRHAGTDMACLECQACARDDLRGCTAALERGEELLASTRAAMAGLALEHAKDIDAIRAEADRLRRRCAALERLLDQVAPQVGELIANVRAAIATEEGRT